MHSTSLPDIPECIRRNWHKTKNRGGLENLRGLVWSGAEGDRTPDLMTASHALSQLSYGPWGSAPLTNAVTKGEGFWTRWVVGKFADRVLFRPFGQLGSEMPHILSHLFLKSGGGETAFGCLTRAGTSGDKHVFSESAAEWRNSNNATR